MGSCSAPRAPPSRADSRTSGMIVAAILHDLRVAGALDRSIGGTPRAWRRWTAESPAGDRCPRPKRSRVCGASASAWASAALPARGRSRTLGRPRQRAGRDRARRGSARRRPSPMMVAPAKAEIPLSCLLSGLTTISPVSLIWSTTRPNCRSSAWSDDDVDDLGLRAAGPDGARIVETELAVEVGEREQVAAEPVDRRAVDGLDPPPGLLALEPHQLQQVDLRESRTGRRRW